MELTIPRTSGDPLTTPMRIENGYSQVILAVVQAALHGCRQVGRLIQTLHWAIAQIAEDQTYSGTELSDKRFGDRSNSTAWAAFRLRNSNQGGILRAGVPGRYLW